ncbi:MAG: tripartite tricarboxylate transporter permease [Nanoarchaeota archaeon]|nr:tripartite tricarboxylate transporter permease [Nanoarchaeota archaeon]
MFFEIMLAIAVGCFFGIFTGLIPGVHMNLVSLMIVITSPVLLEYVSPLFLAIVITSMAITHTFLDNIPSIFLGAPEEDTVLSVLPGHRLLLQGKGFEAVMLTTLGSFFALMFSIVLVPVIIPLASIGYPLIKGWIGIILILLSGFLIFHEKISKLWALIIFLMSGCLGIGVLNISVLNEPLFPLLSGLFGTSMLVLSVKDNVRIPKQELTGIHLETRKGLKALICSVIAGVFCSFLPGLGPSQAAILSSQFTKNLGDKGFLVLVGGLSTVNMVISFVALYVLDKPRNGAIVAISKIIDSFGYNDLILFLGCALVVAGIATFLTVFFSKVFSSLIVKVNYKFLCLSIISLVVGLAFFLDGFLGLFVLAVSTFLGIIPALKGIGRNHMMGVLILPVILYFVL